ncbi:MAG: serine/threonine protein kinase [Myxococcales bacterium]|nr:serine/threonine protein kinase [Myxococcales bacterium]MCB9628447.1 serine/threonine protein kinase [Sandaracinaceae bacterium]
MSSSPPSAAGEPHPRISEPTVRAGLARTERQELVDQTLLAAAAPPLGERLRSLGITTLDARVGQTLGRADGVQTELAIHDAPEGVVTVGALIAEGGMGEVRHAVQHHLRREVAVKRPLPGSEAEVHQAMLHEAWVAGSLEHPNTLPIHTLSRDGDEPLIVMKRVDGRVWSELLAEQRGVPGEERLLDALRVLVEVCRAVHFAHSRGVLHLDLKPDNVMVGEHGEVVLLDWGIAAAFDPGLAPEFVRPSASIEHVCGTLGYLSPEQAMARGEELGPATDVYLLGAVLHEIITGRPPHRSEDEPSMMLALVSSSRALPPEFGRDVPDELAAIATRALAREPAARFPDVDAFRRALEAFIEHRPARALVAKADQLREEIVFLRLSNGGRSSMQALTDEASVEGQLDACRFAYQQALRSWPECAEARAGLSALALLRLSQAEQRLDVAAARAALEDHPAPTADLHERLRALEAAAAADAQRVEDLRKLSADESLDTDRAVRIRLALTGGGTWSVWNVIAGVLDGTGVVPLTRTALLINLALAFSAFLIVLASVGRRPLTSTAVNRRALTIVFAAFAEIFVLWLGAALLDIPAHQAAVLAFGVYVLAGFAVAAVLDPRTWWGSLLMLPLAFGAARWPAHVFYFTAGLGPIGGAGLAYLWWYPSEPDTPAEARS